MFKFFTKSSHSFWKKIVDYMVAFGMQLMQE